MAHSNTTVSASNSRGSRATIPVIALPPIA
jgi:hypothetical protein